MRILLATLLMTACSGGHGADDAGPDAAAPRDAAPLPDVVEPADPDAIALPIEVLGEGGTTVAVTFDLADASGADTLSFTCHRCGYRDSGTNPERGAKASVSLNGGPFVALTDETVTVADPEVRYGGIAGAWATVRGRLPMEGFVEGENELVFRYEGTDGFSIGYRILALDVLAGDEPLIDPSAFRDDDPRLWESPSSDPADVEAGAALWYGSTPLVESPLDDTELRASCSDCHAADGHDLKYFNFSNHSIIERSRFHGLSETEGRQIASYVRSLPGPAPVQARPWNPPYQPGSGLDARPVEEWAAGAGLEAVLEHDAEMLDVLFPDGTSEEAIADAVSTRGTLNVREQPIALQLPDWNAWLPEIHPVDVWGESIREHEVYQAYEDTLTALADGGAERMRTDDEAVRSRELLRDVLDPFRAAVGRFNRGGGPQPCRNTAVHESEAMQLLGMPSSPPPESEWGDPTVCERPMRSISHWSAVKHWEVMQRFGLEDATADVYPYGEARGWPGSQRQVFELAPHRIGNDSFTFAHLTRAQGAYFNTAWYQLQVILNAGNRDPVNHRPPDWKYQMDHLFHSHRLNEHPQPLRYAQTLIEMHQNLDMRPPDGAEPADPDRYPDALRLDRGPGPSGWWLTHVTPWRFVSIGGSFFNGDGDRFAIWDALDEVEPGLRLKLQNALLEAWLDKTETYDPSEFSRGDGQNHVNREDYVPTPYSGSGLISDSATHADGIYRVIPFMRDAGMDEALIERLRLFGERMWPLGDWDALSASP